MISSPQNPREENALRWPWQEAYTALLECTSEAVFIADCAGRLIEANPRFCEATGYSHSEVLKLSLLDLFPGHDLPHSLTQPNPGQPARVTSQMRLRRGQDYQVRPTTLSMRTLSDGSLLGLINAIADEPQDMPAPQAEPAGPDYTPIAIFRLAPDGKILEVSDQTCTSLGYSREELLSLTVFDIDPTLNPEKFRAHRHNLGAQGPRTVESIHRRKDGSTFPVAITISDFHYQGTEWAYSFVEDITRRKEAEAALRESQQRFRLLAEAAFEGIAVTRHGEFLDLNDQWAQMLGYRREELLRAPVLRCVAPEERERVDAFLHSGRPEPHEHLALRKDGAEFPAEIRARTTRIGSQEVCIVTMRDITERKSAEAELRFNEEMFRSTFENSLAGIALVALNGRYVMVNPAFSEIFGYSIEEFLSADFFNITHPDDQELSQRVMREVVANKGKRVRFNKRYVHKDGHTIWAEVASALVYDDDGAASHFVTHVNDVTEKKLAEDALRATRDQIVTITDNVVMLIGHVSVERRFLYVNEVFARFFGKPKAAFVGRHASEVLGEKNYALARPYIERVLSGELVAYENKLPNAAGEQRVVWIQYTPERDEAGRVIGYFTMALDITDRKETELLIQAQQEQLVAQNEELVAQNEELIAQGHSLELAEADLRQINEDLEQRIQARSAELRAANAELQQANSALLRAGRMKDEFLANMSHELRTPLTGILGLTEVMDKGFYGDLTDKQRHALQMVQESGEHLLQLINDILDLSKVEAGAVELQIAPVAIDEICQASLQFVRQIALKKRIQLSLDFKSQVRYVLADTRRLKQMLINLLNNAVKFTPEGGQVGLEVLSKIEGGDAAHRQVLFTVWDNGIGIPPEKQALLFKPFVQLDGSMTRKYEGTGLGLALVRAMAELHGGGVSMESAGLGQGSRFTIALPWTSEAALDAPASAAEGASGFLSLAAALGRPPLIMVVDDSPVTLTVLTNYLEAMSCKVLGARDGAEALTILQNMAQTVRPDLLLIDIQMPGIDGLTVIRRLRAAGSTIPIVAVTALAMSGDRERCLAAGADDYLSKPVKLDQLARAIGRQLGEKAEKARP